ncbi:hypothetical protein FOA43_001158 [Brettanomyces nanus]|uniref:AAA+ ATPase domain-containing protein n=1 Tax=Eeniella nana TaxID=13502 RepID=A0A875RYX3_EENNA|nr:uncharacterized protein FOA43_001158 [Brettanomyces nanus]QPG73843.1 hypothetical protein FOA43_001158 [Brettanomyces nanus]
MFYRNKHTTAPPLSMLTQLYNEVANSSLANLSLEQNGRIREASAGWEMLHESFGPKFDSARIEYDSIDLIEEESFLMDEISVLQAQADDHMERLRKQIQRETPPKPPPHRPSLQQNTSANSHSFHSASPVLTLRSNNPRKNSKSLLKTLRSGASGSISANESQSLSSQSLHSHSHSNSNLSGYSSSAKCAANLIWSPSSSLTTGHSYSSANQQQQQKQQQDPFENFDSDFVTEGEAKQETMQKLRRQGNASKANRKIAGQANEDLIDLADQLSSFSMDSNQSQQFQDYSSQKKTSSQRAQAALQKSAAVRLNIPQPKATKSPKKVVRRSQIVNQNRNMRYNHSSSRLATSNRSRRPPKAESPKKELVLNENFTKDTETLGSDEDNLTDSKKNQEKLIKSLKGVDPTAARQILNEIVVNGDEVHWEDIAGLEEAKKSLKETVVYPFLRPDLFSGLREPARGMLLFGPPGTGKTMLARAVATESQSTFFSISASSLTSKYLGESEKLVRALFQLAKRLAPSIIFVDEIDSLLGTRNNDSENEASRRIKNEFLIQWSDLTKAAAGKDQGEDVQRVLVLAATNLPWTIDEAARRRFVRRQYIPLPEKDTRRAQIDRLMSHQKHSLSEEDMNELLQLTEGFSGSDITALAKDAAMGPLRELGDKLLLTSKSDIRPLQLKDFVSSMKYIRPSVSKRNLSHFEEWAKVYGSSGA